MEKQFTDERTGITYTLHGDYYFPDLEVSTHKHPLSRWGMMYMKHMQEHHYGQFMAMLCAGTLNDHLYQVDQQAEERFQTLMDGYKHSLGITEDLKAKDQMTWVQLMNTARHDAEANVLTEIIYH